MHDHLFDLGGVGANRRQVRRRHRGQLDVLADHAAQHLCQILHNRVQVHRLRLHHLLAAERQQLPGERGGALGGLDNLFDVGANR